MLEVLERSSHPYKCNSLELPGILSKSITLYMRSIVDMIDLAKSLIPKLASDTALSSMPWSGNLASKLRFAWQNSHLQRSDET